jgi:hypothetical protein
MKKLRVIVRTESSRHSRTEGPSRPSAVMMDAAELLWEAENCRQQASVADALTRRILLELADQFQAAARLALAYPNTRPVGHAEK